ncbi:hypothetical protein HPP92_006293 [Vanilla planifolia]|uniref:Uncharacterized protein n=1 Tax=Vanilla planifolia TaxID=51239 RepID=A0A835VDE9_VANPL|nr:hypothetical protein HPP92_006293 [Vanilla planifolia]
MGQQWRCTKAAACWLSSLSFSLLGCLALLGARRRPFSSGFVSLYRERPRFQNKIGKHGSQEEQMKSFEERSGESSSSGMGEDYYRILQVDRNAEDDDLKKPYRKLDKNANPRPTRRVSRVALRRWRRWSVHLPLRQQRTCSVPFQSDACRRHLCGVLWVLEPVRGKWVECTTEQRRRRRMEITDISEFLPNTLLLCNLCYGYGWFV